MSKRDPGWTWNELQGKKIGVLKEVKKKLQDDLHDISRKKNELISEILYLQEQLRNTDIDNLETIKQEK